MATLTFTGTNGDAPVGGTAFRGTFEINTNALKGTGAEPNLYDWMYAISDVDPDLPVSASISTVSTLQQKNYQVFHHWDSIALTGVFWGVRDAPDTNPTRPSGVCKFYKFKSGAFTLLDESYTIPSFDAATFYVFEIEPIDGAVAGLKDRYNLKVDGVTVATVDAVDAEISRDSSEAGIRSGSTFALFDDFTYTAAATAPATKQVTFEIPTDILNKTNMKYWVAPVGGGASIVNGDPLVTSSATVTIDVDSVGTVSVGDELLLWATDKATAGTPFIMWDSALVVEE